VNASSPKQLKGEETGKWVSGGKSAASLFPIPQPKVKEQLCG